MATFLDNRKTLISDLATRLLLEPGVVITDTSFLISAKIAEDLGKNSRSRVWNGPWRSLTVAGTIVTAGGFPIIDSAVAGGAALYVPIRELARAKTER